MVDAIPYTTIMKQVKEDVDYIADQAYQKGYALGKYEHESRWISCEERLPEEKTEVLVTSNGYLYIASYEVLSFGATEYWSESIEYRHITNVTAWMPLPEPYRGES